MIEAAVGAANCIAAPMAAGLLMLDGVAGFRGWQVLFFVEVRFWIGLEGLIAVVGSCSGLVVGWLQPAGFS